MSTASRTLLHIAIGCALLAILADTWLISGVVGPMVVASGSMAPALQGPHRAWICTQCRREFVCGLESLPAVGHPASCPHCQAGNPAETGVDRPGNRVLVDRTAFAWRSPRRWEAVVLECPDAPGELCVKRVVGLPGETIEVRDGDVLADGRIVGKTLTQLREMMTLIDDSARTPQCRPHNTSRWHDADGHWRVDGERFVHPIADATLDRFASCTAWLTYHHPARSAARDVFADGPVLDESSYDQAESRVLNPVGDFLVHCQIACRGCGEISIRSARGLDTFVAAVDVGSGEGVLRHNDDIVATFSAGSLPIGRPVAIDWVLADHQVQLAVQNRVLIEHDFVPSGNCDVIGAPRVAVGAASGVEVEITGLQVWRDIHYTTGPGGSDGSRFRLGSDEYFVLGDNSPHSRDSRWWEPGGVSDGAIIGRALWW